MKQEFPDARIISMYHGGHSTKWIAMCLRRAEGLKTVSEAMIRVQEVIVRELIANQKQH